jgi:ADP-heptose:LPS heptosyltransferase
MGVFSLDRPRRILMFYPRRIGDWVVTTPFLRGLRQKFPEAEIVAVASAKSAAVMPLIPFIDRFHVLGRPENIGQNFGLLKFLLTSGTWDLYIDLDPNPAFSRGGWIFSFLTRAGIKAGFARAGNEGFEIRAHFPEGECPMLERYAIFARAMDIPYQARTELRAFPEDEKMAEREIESLNLARPRILIHPGDLKRESGVRWQMEKFADLGKRLRSENCSLFFLAGPGERPWVQNLAAQIGIGPSYVIGPRPLKEAAAFMRQADLFVSSLNGSSHVAAALGVPTLSLYMGYDWKIWRITGDRHFGLVGDERNCRAIAAEQVYASIKKITDRASLE